MRGVYAIRCADGRAYIGSSINVKERCRNHRNVLNTGKHRNRPLQEAWNKMGTEAFTFAALETVADEEDLLAAEQKWIDAARAEGGVFNRAPMAGSSLGIVRTHETRAKCAEAQRGKRLSAEHRAKIALAGRGRVHSAETRAKMAATHRGELAPMAKITEAAVRDIRRRTRAGEPQGLVGQRYGISQSAVSKICRRETWGYVTDDFSADYRLAELVARDDRYQFVADQAERVAA